MIGPYTEPADLQIICLFKHKASGDTYQGAAKDTDEHLHGLLSALRNRGEFVGELGETFFFTPPSGSIPAKRFMVQGVKLESVQFVSYGVIDMARQVADGRVLKVHRIGPGDLFGEVSLLTGTAASTTLTAITPGLLATSISSRRIRGWD